jgi:hypothetical protein
VFSIESVLYNIYIYIHIYIYRTSWRRLSIAFHIGASLVRRLDTDMERFVDHILLAFFPLFFIFYDRCELFLGG